MTSARGPGEEHSPLTLPLESDEIHVWLLGAARLPELLTGLELSALLSPREYARGLSMVFDKDRNSYWATHALLRFALSAYASVSPSQWAFQTDDWGRPHLAENLRHHGLWFSCTHTDGIAGCAVARFACVGLDIEHTQRRLDVDSLRSCLSSTEASDVNAHVGGARLRRFLEYWTLKEAYVKALGVGMRLPFDRIEFELCSAKRTPPVLRRSGMQACGGGRMWAFLQLELARDLVAAVAHGGPKLGMPLAPPTPPIRVVYERL